MTNHSPTQLLELKPSGNLLPFISLLASSFSEAAGSWESIVENAFSLIGVQLRSDNVEGIIKAPNKRHKYIISWNHSDTKNSPTISKEEADLIQFLFRNKSDDFFYFQSHDKYVPHQLRKLQLLKRHKSVFILNLKYGKKNFGYVSLGFNETNKVLEEDDIKLIKTFGTMVSNYIANQQQSTTIKKLVEKNSEQDRRLKEFAFITSHHLRAFSSNLASLTEYLLINPNEQRFIEMISNSVKKLNGSIEDINEILTHENDLIVEELTKVKINSMFKNIIKWHQKAITVNEIMVENLLPRRLSVISQLEMLENIFSHIFSNAIKYGTNEKSKVIRIDHSKNEDYLIIRIRDFGDGIDMKKHGHKLFKAGNRFSNKSNSNLGMGLFLSKFQIKKIGGRIHLKSEPGKGTSVQCFLPISKANRP